MSKLEIKEVQIDNYNDTNNQLNRFDGGLNIICGPNEIGKSTLMNFIKNIFIRKTDAKGYIKCLIDNQEFSLSAEKNKIKENENFIQKINPYGYNTGFIIDLDDLMFAKKADADELINTVSDSSGNAINLKQSEYENYIYGKKQKFPLTPKNAESTTFKKQFDYLKNLSKQIKELQAKENEYNEICTKIDVLDKEIKKLMDEHLCAEIFTRKYSTLGEVEKIKINYKLLENKAVFENIREEYGALNSSHKNNNELCSNLTKKSEIFDEKLKELNKIEEFNKEDIESFDLSFDTYKYGKNLAEELRTLKIQKTDLEKNIDDLTKQVEELKFETKSTEYQIENLGISNIEEYKTSRDMLESYKDNYSDLLNKARNSESVNTKSANWYNEMFFVLFGAMFVAIMATLVTYWNSQMRLPLIALMLIPIAGIVTVFMEKASRKKRIGKNSFNSELDRQAKEILEICHKHNFKLNKGDNFIVKISSYVQNMNDKISEYKIIENDLLKTRISLEKSKENLNNKNNELEDLNKKIEELNEKINEFLSDKKIKDIENYQEVFENIKELMALNNEISNLQNEIDNYNNSLESFVKNINNFIRDTELDTIQTLNKYDFESFDKNLSTIREIIDKNISEEHLLKELNLRITNYDEELEKLPNDLKEELSEINEEKLNNIKNKLREKQEERGRYIQQKEDLEKVTEILSLKNKKHTELNNLKDGLQKLIQKELIYNIIKSAKEKFNESRPNLVCAKKYLSEITNKKYSEINIDNKTISGENTPEKDWDKLSRGTKEQLYLALRLGFACNYSKDINGNSNDIPNLPLIIDDAFVNFDEKRTISILKCLEDFSQNNQVLYFTCHANTIKNILKKEQINHKLIEL